MVNARWEIGRVGQPRGLKGDVRARLVRNEPLYLEPGRIRLESEPDEVRRVVVRELQGPSVVLHIEGIETREAAEAIHGRTLFVDADWFTQRLPAEALVGGQVLHADSGAPLGVVHDFYDNGAQVVLEILVDEATHLVPYVDNFFVDVKAGAPPVLRLRPIPGLLGDLES